MSKNPIYLIGSIILFLGLFYMFLPHVAHHAIAEGSGESSHFENIIYGLIGTLTGLALLFKSEKNEKLGIPTGNVRYIIEVVAILSVSAGLIHAALIPEHFREWIGYGVFFIVAAFAQLIYAIMILKLDSKNTGKRELYNLYIIGIIGNLLLIAMYVLSRTSGIPFFGPEAGEVEGVGAVDLFSKFLEVGIIIFLSLLMKGLNRVRKR